MAIPVIGDTTTNPVTGTTVETKVIHPFESVTVYLIVALPPETPVTTPDELIVAIPVFMLLQTPEGVVFESATVLSAQIVAAPEIALTTGNGLTVIVMLLLLTT